MDLNRTPLNEFHKLQGAKMVPFAGFEMPVQYPMGTIKEHIHTRTKVGLFDVSHMGQIAIYSKGRESINDIVKYLESILPIDLENFGFEKQKYALLTTENGGIIDDVMITKKKDYIFLIVNAANKQEDLDYLHSSIGSKCEIVELKDRALLAIQGPKAAEITSRILPEIYEMRFLDVLEMESEFGNLSISRSGYTGEDGYEISIPGETAVDFSEKLLSMGEVQFIGLAARDTLRLEAGLCLHGNDIDKSTSVIEAGLWWSVSKARRPGNDKEGGFPGYDYLKTQLRDGVERMLVGLKPRGRLPVRAGNKIYNHETDGQEAGWVTSGGYGATIQGPVAMGYVNTDEVRKNSVLYCEGRRSRIPIDIHLRNFVGNRFKR
ncbi:MAG: glycine cleavage system aminomethyltransferase GcvT [Rhodobacteraceae bacterium]|nr:glycine cleavage system aminomethyltransferase GcvT [Paracoccaceae bacterium]MYF46841.1 glycine cleavage system aminomethyltransferase GcvT [Paracoccaceae bacterium]MYI92695.1 glycine cleavage system aminomethyltransferase GcvT [Paracoccaceae bacterium]